MRTFALSLSMVLLLSMTQPAAADYKRSASGVIMDCNTSLEWMPGLDKDTYWGEGPEWVKKLGEGWRMPTRKELPSLYLPKATKSASFGNVHLDRIFTMSGRNIWSGDEGSKGKRYMIDMVSGVVYDRKNNENYLNRVFAVRKAPTPNVCFPGPGGEGVPRFKDNGDGTVTDLRQNIKWLKNASCFRGMHWDAAADAVKSLGNGMCGLTDKSQPGKWRLPTRDEWQKLVDIKYRSPALGNADGTGQWKEGNSFSKVTSGFYWTGTKSDDYCVDGVRLIGNGKGAYAYSMVNGELISCAYKTDMTNFTFNVWPVRD